MIEDLFDIPYIAEHSLREKQVQQSYRPVIAVHKWFARRPGTLFRGLFLAEFGQEALRKVFTRSNQFPNVTVADPFMGGGSPLVEANRLGANVLGFDINPMSYWVVRQELAHLDLDAYRKEADRLIASLRREIGHLYTTKCDCGTEAPVKYFLWVKQHECSTCSETFDLWPGYRMAKNTRHTAHVVICHQCGELNERQSLDDLGSCRVCSAHLQLEGNSRRNQATCPHCVNVDRYPDGEKPPRHRLYALEYHCWICRPNHKGRFFKKADGDDLEKAQEASTKLKKLRCRFVPDDQIPEGDETKRLHRWGYRHYRDLFNARQLIGLELAARRIYSIENRKIRDALATNLSDLLRYQNLLCRYDSMALKSLDIFSIHGFPVSLVQCESNMLGIVNGKGGNIGSGGWENIVAKFEKAKSYCDKPFETVRNGSRKKIIYTDSEWIGDRRNGVLERSIDLRAADSTSVDLEPNSLDAVFTDPPYFGMVQYAELMDFCYVWLRRIIGPEDHAFRHRSTRNPNELTENKTGGRGLEHFAEGLSRVFQGMSKALKNRRPLVFTFHHNQLSSYAAIGVAVLDARLSCTATLPCPAEMGGSIHIANTSSSILDSVFVCRKNVSTPELPNHIFDGLVDVLCNDVANLEKANYFCSEGDLKCLLNGHLCRMAINLLEATWENERSMLEKLDQFRALAENLVDSAAVVTHVLESDRAGESDPADSALQLSLAFVGSE